MVNCVVQNAVLDPVLDDEMTWNVASYLPTNGNTPVAVHVDVFFLHVANHVKVAPFRDSWVGSFNTHFTEYTVPHLFTTMTVWFPLRFPLTLAFIVALAPVGGIAFRAVNVTFGDFAVVPFTPNAHHAPASPPIGCPSSEDTFQCTAYQPLDIDDTGVVMSEEFSRGVTDSEPA